MTGAIIILQFISSFRPYPGRAVLEQKKANVGACVSILKKDDNRYVEFKIAQKALNEMMANERRPCCSQAKQSVLDSMIYSAKRTVTEERKPSESETLDSPIVSFFLRKCFLPLAYKRAHVAYGHERSIIDYSAACRCVPHRVPAPNAYARKRGARAMLLAMLHARGARGRNAILEHASPLLGSGLGKIRPWVTTGIVTAGRGPGRSGRGALISPGGAAPAPMPILPITG